MRIVVIIVPGMTQLDFTGPLQVLSRMPEAEVLLAAASREPVMTDAGFAVVPTCSFEEAPIADILLVPGGEGIFDALGDERVLAAIRRQAAAASWVTSVCTGAFLLGAAGLLDGRRATTHWASLPMLASFGAIAVSERVVVDGNTVTGGGVTAGIDFALNLVALIHGNELAERIQLQLEYDPAPPFEARSAASAPAATVAQLRAATLDRRGERVAAAAARLQGSSVLPPRRPTLPERLAPR